MPVAVMGAVETEADPSPVAHMRAAVESGHPGHRPVGPDPEPSAAGRVQMRRCSCGTCHSFACLTSSSTASRLSRRGAWSASEHSWPVLLGSHETGNPVVSSREKLHDDGKRLGILTGTVLVHGATELRMHCHQKRNHRIVHLA
jgi:hypothetical protein